jgi:hypothetical protein
MLIVDALIQNRQFLSFPLAIPREACYISERLVGRRDLSVRLPEGPAAFVPRLFHLADHHSWSLSVGLESKHGPVFVSRWEKFDGDEVVCG